MEVEKRNEKTPLQPDKQIEESCGIYVGRCMSASVAHAFHALLHFIVHALLNKASITKSIQIVYVGGYRHGRAQNSEIVVVGAYLFHTFTLTYLIIPKHINYDTI